MEISSKKTCFLKHLASPQGVLRFLLLGGEAILLNDDMFQKDVGEAFFGKIKGTWDDPSFKFSDLELLSGRCEVESFRVSSTVWLQETRYFQRCDR